MNKGLTAAITIVLDGNNKSIAEQLDDVDGHFNCFSKYLPDVALIGHNFADPKNLDEVLQGPNTKEW